MKFAYISAAALALVQGFDTTTREGHFYEEFLGKVRGDVQGDPMVKCCTACEAPMVKYHSVDHIFNNCGESCMDPKKFWIYKLFEPGLTLSDTNTPCADRKYTDYKGTPTHGVWPVQATLDMYGPTKEEVVEVVEEPVEVEVIEIIEEPILMVDPAAPAEEEM